MQAQVVLDRLGFTPGVVDGKMGMSTVNAHQGLPGGPGHADHRRAGPATVQALAQWKHIPATRVVTIPRRIRQRQFVDHTQGARGPGQADRHGLSLAGREDRRALPHDRGGAGRAQSAVDRRPSAAADERRRPTRPAKPAIAYRAGMQLRVPNIGADRFDPSAVKDPKWADTLRLLGVGTDQPQGRQDRGRQVRPGAARARQPGQAARPVHRDHGLEPVPAAARHLEDPGRRLQSAVAI